MARPCPRKSTWWEHLSPAGLTPQARLHGKDAGRNREAVQVICWTTDGRLGIPPGSPARGVGVEAGVAPTRETSLSALAVDFDLSPWLCLSAVAVAWAHEARSDDMAMKFLVGRGGFRNVLFHDNGYLFPLRHCWRRWSQQTSVT